MGISRALRPIVVVAVLVAAAPAEAVVSGVPTDPRAYPWMAGFGDCAATLVRPDRAVTAAHCVERVPLAELPTLRFGSGDRRRAVRVAMHPGWARALHANDIALLALDRPVTAVRQLPLVGPEGRRAIATGRRLRLLGRGSTRPPRVYRARARRGLRDRPDRLRRTDLRVVSDAACGRFWRRAREAFTARTMLCASDPDGRPPYRSACMGDSGGPLLAGRRGSWALAGVVSWGGSCGADRDPSVFTEVPRFTGFVTDPAPVWRPRALAAPRVEGDARPGATLTCAIAWDVAPDDVVYEWSVEDDRGGQIPRRGHTPTWTPGERDAGSRISCAVLGSNAGGVEATEESVSRRISSG